RSMVDVLGEPGARQRAVGAPQLRAFAVCRVGREQRHAIDRPLEPCRVRIEPVLAVDEVDQRWPARGQGAAGAEEKAQAKPDEDDRCAGNAWSWISSPRYWRSRRARSGRRRALRWRSLRRRG